MAKNDLMDRVVNLTKRRGLVFPSSEIYGGFRSTWDYGPLGVLLKRNVKDAWWRSMVQLRDDVVGLDSAILMPPRSGRPVGTSPPSPTRWSIAAAARNGSARTSSPNRARARTAAPRTRSPRPASSTSCSRRMSARSRTRRRSRTCARRPRRASSSTSRTCRRRTQEAAVRNRADRQVVPQRDHAGQLHLPHPRVRADGDGVLRPARRGTKWFEYWCAERFKLVRRPRDPRRRAAPPASRSRRALALLGWYLRHRVPVPVGLGRARGHRQPHRLRPGQHSKFSGERPRPTSTRPPTRATCRM